MDSLTHIAIGACIGDLFLGKKIGKKAMLYGAIAASLPDIDFIASFWLSTADDLMAHRGFTHSFLFGILFILALAFLFRHRHRVENIPIKTWLLFMGTEIASHLFLDAFNAYGIGWFEPFSHRRISFHVIFVADPFFSVWPGLAALGLLIMRNHSSRRRRWAITGLAGCSIYLLYCVVNKLNMDRDMRQSLAGQDIHYNRYFTTPTPFNNWLWYDVAETDSGFQIGYHSVFDKDHNIRFRLILRKDYLLDPFRNRHDLHELMRFSQGYYSADTSARGIVFSDLRFGQMMGWQNPDAQFVFHYYLEDSRANHLVVQRGRFAHWNWESIRFFVKRITGKE
ncbi:MAG TPA: metal-dependent hydrolase [Puia sp.]|jgi:inner membrane protein